jgi:hypothetical protein
MKWFFAKTSKQVFSAAGNDLQHYEGKVEYVELEEDDALELDALPPAERSVDEPESQGETETPLGKMTKAELVKLAAEKGVAIDATATKAVILALLTPTE